MMIPVVIKIGQNTHSVSANARVSRYFIPPHNHERSDIELELRSYQCMIAMRDVTRMEPDDKPQITVLLHGELFKCFMMSLDWDSRNPYFKCKLIALDRQRLCLGDRIGT